MGDAAHGYLMRALKVALGPLGIMSPPKIL
jgi:hypothetical protein